ncbi:hypothetical protein L2750_14140 [Shewanella submarina]|uniref:Uncharacterized protein n=1 Tax=Shewanella submarina TaxID=2016376 RepID=A0ABV7GHX4_9GAMM|nr:hypothetical protein [Shewanella submarina]MCL1038276.1 hypothetical protein [Shewanella submarina]
MEEEIILGDFLILTRPHEVRMSHWIYAPVVTHRQNGRLLLDLSRSQWDFIEACENSGKLVLYLRPYGQNQHPNRVELLLCPDTDTIILNGQRFPASSAREALQRVC